MEPPARWTSRCCCGCAWTQLHPNRGPNTTPNGPARMLTCHAAMRLNTPPSHRDTALLCLTAVDTERGGRFVGFLCL